jgi:hypothetical protein
MKTISMIKVAEILKEKGFKAEFCMTGGNTGTIYIGEFDTEGNAEFAIGPSSYIDDEAYFGEVCWGIDGTEDAFYYEGTEEDFTEENIAKSVMEFMTAKEGN